MRAGYRKNAHRANNHAHRTLFEQEKKYAIAKLTAEMDSAKHRALEEFLQQQDLPENIHLTPLSKYNWAIVGQPLAERGIGEYEIIAAIEYAPVIVGGLDSKDAYVYYRGDLAVQYNPLTNTITHVSSLKGRNTPRMPLQPKHRDLQQETPVAKTRLIKHEKSRGCWDAFIEDNGPGHVFTAAEFIAAHEHCGHSAPALQQQLSTAKPRGEVVNSGNDPDLFPNKWRITHPEDSRHTADTAHTIPTQAAEEFTPQAQPTPEPEDDQVYGRHEDVTTGAMLLQEARASVKLDGETQSLGPILIAEPRTENPIPKEKVIPETAGVVHVARTPEQAIRHHLSGLAAALQDYEGEWTMNLARDSVDVSIIWKK